MTQAINRAERTTMDFHEELARHGPNSTEPRMSLAEARAYCIELATSHYENFSVLSWLTPRHARPHFAAIYAFCRWSDDLGDEVGDPARSRGLLHWWEDELRKMYEGAVNHPILVALQDTVNTYEIPIGPFVALISAFLQDQDVTTYQNFEQLVDYSRRSADPVGHLVLYLACAYNFKNAQLSDLTCTGLQLANFWQDVARDLEIGRIYLPEADRDRFGVSEQTLMTKISTPEYRELLRFEVGRAREMLVEGRVLLGQLSGRYRRMVDVFNRGGLAILEAIEQANFDTLSQRPRVGKVRKARLILQASLGLPVISTRTRPAVAESAK